MSDTSERIESMVCIVPAIISTLPPFNASTYPNTVCVDPDELFDSCPQASTLFHMCWGGRFKSADKHYRVIRRAKRIIVALHGDAGNSLKSLIQVEKYPIVGFTVIAENLKLEIPASIEEVMTMPGWDHRGIGSALMVAAIKESHQMGIQKLQLTCKKSLVTFYGEFGFKIDFSKKE